MKQSPFKHLASIGQGRPNAGNKQTRRARNAGPRNGEHVTREKRLWVRAAPCVVLASDGVRVFDSYGLLSLKLCIRKASAQIETCDAPAKQGKTLWIPPGAVGIRPEQSIPAIPPPPEPANAFETRSFSPARRVQWHMHKDRCPEPAEMGAERSAPWGGADLP